MRLCTGPARRHREARAPPDGPLRWPVRPGNPWRERTPRTTFPKQPAGLTSPVAAREPRGFSGPAAGAGPSPSPERGSAPRRAGFTRSRYQAAHGESWLRRRPSQKPFSVNPRVNARGWGCGHTEGHGEATSNGRGPRAGAESVSRLLRGKSLCFSVVQGRFQPNLNPGSGRPAARHAHADGPKKPERPREARAVRSAGATGRSESPGPGLGPLHRARSPRAPPPPSRKAQDRSP